MDAALPPAASKLRIVLDYLPCEACLAQPVADQDLLCSVCARLDRHVAVRVASRTTVILERPEVQPPAAPVVIEPAAPAPQPEPGAPEIAVAQPEAPPAPPPLAVVFRGDELPADPLFTVVVEPYEEPAPLPPPVAPVPEAAVDEAVIAEPAPAEPAFDDLAFAKPEAAPASAHEEEPVFEDSFEFVAPADAFEFVRPEAAPSPAETLAAFAEDAPQDDFVFRPPTREEPPAPEPAPEPEEPPPTEEIAVEPAPETSLWSPPDEFLPDETLPLQTGVEAEVVPEEEPVLEAELVPEEEPVLEAELVPDEEPVLEAQLVEDEVEMEVLPDEEAAPAAPSTDLYRLRGFDAAAEGALARQGIRELSHLAGHDAGELAERSGLPLQRLLPWTQVANLHVEIGVPLDAAQALVNAGVAGPRGLREMDAETIVDRVAAFGGARVSLGDVKRWKRRA